MIITHPEPIYIHQPLANKYFDELVEFCRNNKHNLYTPELRNAAVAQNIYIFRIYFDGLHFSKLFENSDAIIEPDVVYSSYEDNEATTSYNFCKTMWQDFYLKVIQDYDIHEKFEKPPYSLYEYVVLPYEIASGIKNIADFSTEMLESLCREYSITKISEEIDDSLASHYEECKKNRGKGIVAIYRELNRRISKQRNASCMDSAS